MSAIVLLWNGAPFVAACVASIRAQTLAKVEIILVDNASRDDTVAIVERAFPDLPLIRNERNLGFAGGMNVGIRAARAPIVVLLNQDLVLNPDCLARIVNAFAEEPSAGAVGCKIFFPDRMLLQHAGGYLERPLALGHHYGYGELDTGQYDEPRDVEYVTGAAIGLRRGALDEVGLLDEQFWPGYFEEVDLCRRLLDAGWRVCYRPEAVAVHWESTSLGRNSDPYYTAYHRGRLRYVLKHFGDEEWRAFATAEAERYATLASIREQRMLTTVYRELSGVVERERPAVLPYYRRLLRLEPTATPQRLPGMRRYFHPARARDFNRAMDTLRRSWMVLGPPVVPPERTPLGLALGLLRTASWLVVRWSFLPVLEQQDNYNRAVIETFERWRDEYEHLLNRLINLIDSLEAAIASLDDRDERLEGELSRGLADLTTLRSLVGETVGRRRQVSALADSSIDELNERFANNEAALAAVDRDVVRLRRALALAQTRLAVARSAEPSPNGSADQAEDT
ncbi:MAG: glycosyltransferase [Dehalococcoidia bacterium]